MDTLAPPGNGTVQPPPVGTRPRRRWPRIVLASFLTMLTAFAAYAGWFLANYQPLTEGSASGVGRQARDLGFFTSPHSEDFEAYRLVFHDGERFEFALTMRNDGPIGVTVTGVGGGTEGTVVPFVQTHVLLADRSGEYMYDISPGHRHRFRSFSLA